jgi:hypothetical protein
MTAVVPEFLQPFMPEMPYHYYNVMGNMTYDKHFLPIVFSETKKGRLRNEAALLLMRG